MNKVCITLLIVSAALASGSGATYPKSKISNDIEITQLSSHSYIHTSFTYIEGYGRVGSNGYIYINNNEAILFDTPMTEALTKQLVNWITVSLNAKIIGCVPNHWHGDCMGGLDYIHSLKIPSYANNQTIAIAKQKKLPVPQHGFNDTLTLKVGTESIVCTYYGAAHSSDNIVVWVASEKILFAGCMVKDANSKSLGNVSDANISEWPKTIDKLIKAYSTAKIVIPGHGNFGGTELFIHTKELLHQIK